MHNDKNPKSLTANITLDSKVYQVFICESGKIGPEYTKFQYYVQQGWTDFRFNGELPAKGLWDAFERVVKKMGRRL